MPSYLCAEACSNVFSSPYYIQRVGTLNTVLYMYRLLDNTATSDSKNCVILSRVGRCQQLTPPESRKMWSFRKKSKNISCVFLLLFFFFFGKISWNFWFFGVTLGKISSRSSEPWRKNKKRKVFGLFLAGRNLWNFGATPYCKSEQTRLYHNSAKSARIGLRF